MLNKKMKITLMTITSIVSLYVNSISVFATSYENDYNRNYTQDDYGAMWEEWAEEHGINMDDYKTTGGC